MPNSDAMERLLEQLSSGDNEAVERVFREYEPYLRMVVRRALSKPLRAKFDSVDIVQSVWADLLHGFRQGYWRFENVQQLRAFLVQATRHRLVSRSRQQKAALRVQQGLQTSEVESPACPAAEPSELAQAQEIWEFALSTAPPQHRALLLLKREGCTIEEIAQRSGLHPGSVRRILNDLTFKVYRKAGKPEPDDSA